MNQDNWVMEDFYYLNRYLNKLILQSEKREKEINDLDGSKMSVITKTILIAIVKFQNKEYLLDRENLSFLKEVKPLDNWFDLVPNPTRCHAAYNEYKIGW